MISNEMKNLVEKFNNISKKGWLKSIGNNTGSVGLTFENELNKNPDSLFFPDFNGIEIKCTTRFSNFPFSLFSLAFDGPSFPEINRLVDLYGYKDYKYDKKVLRADINSKEKKQCGNYQFKLSIDEIENKLYLEVYDLKDKLIERKSFVYLDTILNHLNVKLSNLAIIHGSKRNDNNGLFFRYYRLDGYRLRKDIFLSLLKQGKIFVTLESRIGKTGKNAGKYKNKNLVFKIKKEHINLLFNKLFSIDTDKGVDRLEIEHNDFYIMK